ncbi:hypothetical protein [Mucilaginibacter sp.]
MKKIILSIMMILAIGFASFAHAQDRVDKRTVKVKKTSSFKQKIHNTFHKHHKEYNGYKVKTKVRK